MIPAAASLPTRDANAEQLKKTLRSQALAERNALAEPYRNHVSRAIGRRLYDRLSALDARRVATYFPIGTEVSILPVLEQLYAAHVEVAFPVVTPEFDLELYWVPNLGDLVPRGRFRIPEPVPERHARVDLHTLDAIVVPGLLWDIDGYRIGYGKGCFDRLLARVPHHATRIGVGMDEFLHRRLPRQGFDLPTDCVLTPNLHLALERAVWESHAPEQTIAVGREIGKSLLTNGGVVALVGPLGAGKTHLARGLADALGVDGDVNSPSYTLAARHGDRMSHVDLYRLDPEALDAADAFVLDEEIEAVHCTVVEWADRAWNALPPDATVVSLRVGQNGIRVIECRHYREPNDG